MGRFYSILFNNRSAADYEDFKNFDLAATQEMYPKVCAFIGLIDNWVFSKNYGSRSKKGEIPRFELSHNALNRKPQK